MTDIDELLDTIELMKAKQKATNDLYDDQIAVLTKSLEKELMKAGKDCYETKTAVAFYRSNPKVDVEDWNVVMEYIAANGAFDILQRRISPAALETRINAGADIKGVKISKGKTLIVKGKKANAKDSEQS